MPYFGQKQKVKTAIYALAVLFLGGAFIFCIRQIIFRADIYPPGESQIEGLTTNWQDYEAQGSTLEEPKVPKYEKFELIFDINWYHNRQFNDPEQKYNPIADETLNPYWPYDKNPSSNTQANIDSRGDGKMPVEPGVGISVDGLFSSDNWQTTVTQPGFYFQDYNYTQKQMVGGGIDAPRPWFYPKGNPVWKIRFAPEGEGVWQYKIRVRDASGETIYDGPSGFSAISSLNHGFAKVSSSDSRYFETSDGTTLNLVGTDDITLDPQAMDAKYAELKNAGINLIRPWWQASQGPVMFGLSGQGGVAQSVLGTYNVGSYPLASGSQKTVSGELFSYKLDQNGESSFYKEVPVKPNTHYKFSSYVKTVGLEATGSPAGLGLDAVRDRIDDTRSSWPAHIVGDNNWQEISADIYTKDLADANFIRNLSVHVLGRTAGAAYVSRISFREDLGGGNYGPEIFSKPDPNVYQYISPDQAWVADYQVNKTKENGIYLKIVAEEKQDVAFGNIGTNGLARVDDSGNLIPLNAAGLTDWLYAYTNDNSTANPPDYKNDSAGRVYQTYYWRYLIARYGYATNIHSFEFVNEGDPGNGYHQRAAGAMGNYFNQNDPNKHLVTTSFYHTLARGFIAGYQDIGYGDWHKYIGDNIDWNICGHPCDNNDAYVPGWWSWSNFAYYFKSGDDPKGPRPRDPPGSLFIDNSIAPGAPDYPYGKYLIAHSNPFPVVPGHSYTLSYKLKGEDLNYYRSDIQNWTPWQDTSAFMHADYSTIFDLTDNYTDSSFLGTFDWKEHSSHFKIKAKAAGQDTDAWITTLFARVPNLVNGKVWFDDITLYDETAGKSVEVLNSDFEENRLDYDSALMAYNFGYQVGEKDNRQIKKPIIVGETAIAGSAESDTQNGLAQDTEGIWYKKFIWGNVNQFGVIAMYWRLSDQSDFITKGFGKYAKAYQNFMADIPLTNGQYQAANVTTSDHDLRAWGQKDLTNNKAYLWIDNKPSNWKNIVDGVPISPISGTVTIPNLKDGIYHLQWYDTSSGEITDEEDLSAFNSNLNIPIDNLSSDIALKVEIQSVTPVNIASARTFTYKTRYRVSGTKSGDVIKVLVNNEEALIDGDTWSLDLDLVLGQNTIRAIGEDTYGTPSEPAVYTLSRRKMADANGDNDTINMKDFAVLMSDWDKNNINLQGDLNEDNQVNITDFSMMMANWEK